MEINVITKSSARYKDDHVPRTLLSYSEKLRQVVSESQKSTNVRSARVPRRANHHPKREPQGRKSSSPVHLCTTSQTETTARLINEIRLASPDISNRIMSEKLKLPFNVRKCNSKVWKQKLSQAVRASKEGRFSNLDSTKRTDMKGDMTHRTTTACSRMRVRNAGIAGNARGSYYTYSRNATRIYGIGDSRSCSPRYSKSMCKRRERSKSPNPIPKKFSLGGPVVNSIMLSPPPGSLEKRMKYNNAGPTRPGEQELASLMSRTMAPPPTPHRTIETERENSHIYHTPLQPIISYEDAVSIMRVRRPRTTNFHRVFDSAGGKMHVGGATTRLGKKLNKKWRKNTYLVPSIKRTSYQESNTNPRRSLCAASFTQIFTNASLVKMSKGSKKSFDISPPNIDVEDTYNNKDMKKASLVIDSNLYTLDPDDFLKNSVDNQQRLHIKLPQIAIHSIADMPSNHMGIQSSTLLNSQFEPSPSNHAPTLTYGTEADP